MGSRGYNLVLQWGLTAVSKFTPAAPIELAAFKAVSITVRLLADRVSDPFE